MNLAAHPHLLDLLAASHAVGTLRGGARRRFETLAREQPVVRAAALTWQGRLAAMTELQVPVTPDPAVWLRIRNLIDAERQQQAIADQRTSLQTRRPEPARGGWFTSLLVWRGAALAGALATVLASVISLDLKRRLDNAPTVQYVAVLADDKAAPSMLVTFDPKHSQLVLQHIGNHNPGPDKSLQLWALPPGGSPRSLGVLGNDSALKLAASHSQVQVPALAVSLEPKGGSPNPAGPTGPVLFHGALIEKTL